MVLVIQAHAPVGLMLLGALLEGARPGQPYTACRCGTRGRSAPLPTDSRRASAQATAECQARLGPCCQLRAALPLLYALSARSKG